MVSLYILKRRVLLHSPFWSLKVIRCRHNCRDCPFIYKVSAGCRPVSTLIDLNRKIILCDNDASHLVTIFHDDGYLPFVRDAFADVNSFPVSVLHFLFLLFLYFLEHFYAPICLLYQIFSFKSNYVK